MGLQIPLDETNPEGGGKKWIDEECDVQFMVNDYTDRSADEKPRLEFKLVVVSATKPAQIGREMTEEFYLTQKALGRLLELACALGLYNKQQWKADKEAGVNPDIEFGEAIGRCFCARVRLKPGTKNPEAKFAEIGFDIWACGDEDAFHIPLDAEYVGSMPNGLIRKDGTLFKRTAAPMPRPKPGIAGSNGAPKTPVAPVQTRPAGTAAAGTGQPAAAGASRFFP
jgi:hypothetical protein